MLAIEPSVSDLSKINKELPVKDFLTIHNKSIFIIRVPKYLIIFLQSTQKEKHCYSLILLGFKSLERQSFISDILRPPSATNSRKFLHLFNVEPPMQIQRRNVRNTHREKEIKIFGTWRVLAIPTKQHIYVFAFLINDYGR